ncbi:MAG: outer membrane beta-barrel protein [Candidatus Eisenbacteria bacterium]|nr:outer membrane beta-barrel protein [Candidatus Eisenbacteria bacterium]
MRIALRRLHLHVFVTLVFVLSMSIGQACAASHGLGLGAHGGYGASDDAESGSALFGAHLELRPAGFLGIVGAISYKVEEDFVVQPVTSAPASYSVHSMPVSVMARLYLPLPGIAPYVTAGAQWRYISYDFEHLDEAIDNFSADDSETAFGWIAGGGLEFHAAPRIALFGEARFEFVDANRDFGDADMEEVEDFDYDQWALVGGITFLLQ